MKALRRILVSIALLMLLVIPDSAAAQPDYIRLHIIADSDTIAAQVLKLCIRNDIREYSAQLLSGCSDASQAWQLLELHQDNLLKTAQESASRYGFDGNISLETGLYPFPDRLYGEELVPAGEYRAIRITLGEGQGRNWWCVVYPSLCLPSDADIDRPIEFYSTVWRWLIHIKEVIFS